MNRADGRGPFLLPLLLFVGLFALVPAALLFAEAWASSGGLAGVGAVVGNGLDRLSVENSLLQGGLSAGLAVALGYPVGLLLGRYDWPGRSIVRSWLLVPFLLPSLVVVFGLEELFGPGGLLAGPVPALAGLGSGLPAILLANLLFNAPIVALFTATGCAGASRELEESVATLGGGAWRAYRDAWGGPTAVGAAAGALLTFLFSALSFAPPLILGGPRYFTVEARIYEVDRLLLSPGPAGLLALLMVALFLPATAAYLLVLGRLRARPGRRRAATRRPSWRDPVAVGGAGATAALLTGVGGLMAAVLYRSLRPLPAGPWGVEWVRLFAPATADLLGLSAAHALANTLGFALAAAVITLLLGVAAGHALARRPVRAGAIGAVLFAPLLISPVVLAFALAQIWRPVLGGESGVWALVIVSQAVLALPFAVQSLVLPLTALPPDAADAARTLGATPWTAYLDVDLPRVRDGLATAGLFAFALGLGEFTATYFLVTPTFTTVPVALYDVAEYTRQFALADVLAGLLLVLSLAAFAALALGGRRVEL